MEHKSESHSKLNPSLKPFLLGLSISVLVIGSALSGALADRLFVIKPLDALVDRVSVATSTPIDETLPAAVRDVIDKESVVIDVSEKSAKSVVTVAIKEQQQVIQRRMTPFDLFGFGFEVPQTPQQPLSNDPRDIGTGFVVDSQQGLIVTNKHVVSNVDAEYYVFDKEGKEYRVERIYRDPANDIAIVKVTTDLPALQLGDSANLKVGQSVIAIGTALGEFRHTVTTGVISGLGRGIYAGDGFGGSVERLDNVIQTDAAINPGNSGGPLLDSQGRVIGVSVAVAGNAQNIGFAIPINTIKETITNFQQTGSFDRPLLGVQYQMINQRSAAINEIPQGAYIVKVVQDSSADVAGIQEDDVITKFDGQDLAAEGVELAKLINKKKIGDTVAVEYWRNGETKTVQVVLKGEIE